MAFQFKRDPSENLTLTLAGDIDLEVTPDIKGQMNSQLGDARSLTIDAGNVSYLDSSGVSILVIAMQSCKQRGLSLAISRISDEAFRVLELAKLDKILPIQEKSGPARLVDVDVFSPVGERDSELAKDMAAGGDMPHSDDDLIAAISSGSMGGEEPAAEAPAAEPAAPAAPAAPAVEDFEAPPEPVAAPVTEIEMTPEPTPQPAAQPATEAPSAGDDGGDPEGGKFTPGTFN